MDHIIQALERAEQREPPHVHRPRPLRPSRASGEPARAAVADVAVGLGSLEANHVIAHDAADPRSRSFDLLRTQTLQAMEAKGWRLLGVTSPSAGCGKTFTALNLALSMARQPDSAVLLIDLDLQKPQITRRLGIEASRGMRSLLDGKSTLRDATMNVAIGGIRFRLLPTERASSRSSDWAGSSALSGILNEVRSADDVTIAIVDMPPILAGDDAISILPQLDCMLMVAGAGQTTTAQIKECANYVKKTPLVRVVLNRAPEAPPIYY